LAGLPFQDFRTLARLLQSAIYQVVTKFTVPPESVSEAAAAEAIDAGVLARLRIDCDSQGAPLSDELLEIYAAELQPRLGAIHDAISRLDASALNHAAHALKGASSLIGARAMAELCLQLEQVARSGAMTEAGALLPELGREAARLCDALAALSERKADH